MKIHLLITIISLLAPGAYSGGAYSAFWDSSGKRIGKTNFELTNPGCFELSRQPDALNVVEDGGFGPVYFPGPYCLHAFHNTGCKGWWASADYRRIWTFMDDGFKLRFYDMISPVKNGSSYMWTLGPCKEPISCINATLWTVPHVPSDGECEKLPGVGGPVQFPWPFADLDGH